MNKVISQDNIEEQAGKALNEMVNSRNGKSLLMLLSGGSSLKLLDYIEADNLTGVTFGMLDDRYSYDASVNAFMMLAGGDIASGFFTKVVSAGATFLDSAPGELESLETYAEKYELEIKKWIGLYPDGIIRATIGIGPDGHTSGVLPFPENPEKFNKLFNSEKLVVGYDVGNKNPHRYRMTSTFTLMRKLDQSLTFIIGENKREALTKVLAEEGSLAETPGRIVRDLKNHTIFTDIKI
jgi:6-phosphogluconolactonase/glucosamine-6-phosphate isomerase/deaminase